MHSHAPITLCVAALLLLGRRGVVAQADPPDVMGITLGDSAPTVLRVLGAPEGRQESLGLRFWDYARRGISLTLDKFDDRVHVITVTQASAGAVAGVRVGDPVSAVRAHWGPVARLRDHGRFLDFIRRGWTCTADVRRGSVAEITLTLAPPRQGDP